MHGIEDIFVHCVNLKVVCLAHLAHLIYEIVKGYADIININDDLEFSQSNIDKLDKLFKAAVTAEIEKRLAGNAPKGNVGTVELTKENAKKHCSNKNSISWIFE